MDPKPINTSESINTKKWGLWILAVFALPFLAIGVSTLFRAFRVLASPRPDLFELVFFWPFGLIFSTFGGIMLAIAVFGKEIPSGVESPLAIRKRLMGIRTPQEQWNDGLLVSDGKGSVIGAWLKWFLGLVLVGPFVWMGVGRGILNRDTSYAGWSVTALIPLYLAVQAIYRTLRLQKFGRSVCEIQRKPTKISDEFRVLVHLERDMLPEGNATLELRCEKREMVGAGKNRQLQITVLWKDQKSMHVSSMEIGITGDFRIPAEIPDAAPDKLQGIFWILEARNATPGIDYYARFDCALMREK